MITNKKKTIKMLLYDGTLNGVTNISNSAWGNGKMYSAPRESINKLLNYADCKKYGVYLLLSDQQVYVGQAIDLERRTKQHLTDKEWWSQVVLMTTNDDSFTASDIDYLEACLINLAVDAGTSDSDNKKRGNRQKVDEFRQPELEQYLDEALFLLELIGVRVFKKQIREKDNSFGRALTLGKTQNASESKKDKQVKPSLPEASLGACVFAKTAFVNLLKSGYQFSDEQIQTFGSVEGSKAYTKRNLPMFWLLKDGESRATCDKNVRRRYWKEEFVLGKYRLLMYSQWYDEPKKGATKENFAAWYQSI